ncbi:MAG TPA: hypothetical protein VII61_06755 [Ktedonobacteraceae bacterium]
MLKNPFFCLLPWRVIAPTMGGDGGGGATGGGDDELETGGNIITWWENFQKRFDYPLYAILLVGGTDIQGVEILVNYRSELDMISDKDCCFIYFRNMNKFKTLAPFDASEHIKLVYSLARFVNLSYDHLPCILFFEQIDSGQYIHISLAGYSEQAIINLIRDIFGFLQQRKNRSQFDQLKRFRISRQIRQTGSDMLVNIMQMGRDVFIEMIKSLVTFK